jgi:large subunit ribosomal protein L29
MATAADLTVLDLDELESRLSDSQRELFNLRFQLATGQLDNSARVNRVKKDVARILTVLREREIAEAEGTYVAPTAEQQASARAHLAALDEADAEARSAHEHEHDEDDDEDAVDEIDDIEDDDADDVDDVDDAEEEDEEADG